MGALPSMDRPRRFNGWRRARQSMELRRSMDCRSRVNGSNLARQWIDRSASMDRAASAHIDHVTVRRMHFTSVMKSDPLRSQLKTEEI